MIRYPLHASLADHGRALIQADEHAFHMLMSRSSERLNASLDFMLSGGSRGGDDGVNWGTQLACTALLWASSAFATVELGAVLAGSLAATSIADDAVEQLRTPWGCFRIFVPPGVLGDDSADVFLSVDAFSAMVTVDGELGFASFGAPSLAELAAEVWRTDEDEAGAIARFVKACARIALGVCAQFDSETNPAPVPPKSWPSSKRKRGADVPNVWRFKLVRDVHVDCRSAVRAFIEHGGRHPTVQSLVRGHHKRQPCGPGGAQRKWIHVEPYWRGPEDAPVAVRAHSVRGSATARTRDRRLNRE